MSVDAATPRAIVGSMTTPPPRTAAATAANQRYAAQRAAGDPARLARAVRIVRIALRRGRVSLEELTTEPELHDGG